jgi:hypothetical protein
LTSINKKGGFDKNCNIIRIWYGAAAVRDIALRLKLRSVMNGIRDYPVKPLLLLYGVAGQTAPQ